MSRITRSNIEELIKSAHALDPLKEDYTLLLERIGNARFVLIGEASHGTHEFYHTRAELTKKLITEKGFTAVAIEGDWPAAYRVNQFVQGASNGPTTARKSLNDFKRFPTWMWRNKVVLDFITWLHDHNADKKALGATTISFLGLDLYSLHHSIEAVISYLDKVDPEAAKRARDRYSCFDKFGPDLQAYGYLSALNVSASCQKAVIAQLVELRKKAFEYVKNHSTPLSNEFFSAEQNALLIKNAEEYYRSLFTQNDASSWNIRDSHMMETLISFVNHSKKQEIDPKVVIWAHNSHLGDARATQMAQQGELNLGQLVRQYYEDESVLIGFSTYTGTVSAASEWGGIVERKHVRPALNESYEELFHLIQIPRFLLLLDDHQKLEILKIPRLQRAIGVIYRPETERQSHYLYVQLTQQFDALFHFDHTHAVEPLDKNPTWEEGEFPETFPYGL
jgi:erythromycin esterase-like protein